MTQKPLEQSSIIDVLFGDDIKELREKFKSWFIGRDGKKTDKNLVILVEDGKLKPGKIEEYKYTLIVGEPGTGTGVARVDFSLKIRRDKI